MSNTPLETARKVLQSVVAKKAQFGKMYRLEQDNEYSGEVILESIATVLQHADFESDDLKEKNLTLSKQNRAAKAREGKLKKQVERMKTKLEAVKKRNEEVEGYNVGLASESNNLQAQVNTLEKQVKRLTKSE